MILHDGIQYARVSDILKPFSNFDGIDKEVLNNKASIGTMVHEAIEDYLLAELPVLRGEARPYFRSFLKWHDEVLPIFIETEKRYFDKDLRITGKIDALAVLTGSNTPVLIDYKTSAQESSVVWPMQAHLYHHLICKEGRKIAPRFLFIKLDRDGQMPKVFEYKFCQNIHRKCMKAVEDFWISHR